MPPALPTKIDFSESEEHTHIIVSFDRAVVTKIPFVGQFAKTRDHLIQIRNDLGDARFRAAAPQITQLYTSILVAT